MRRASILAVLVVGFLAEVAHAAPLTVAIYAPTAPFASGAERFGFITRLAQQLSLQTGKVFEGKVYARHRDFEHAMAEHKVDFALLDGLYLAERGVPYPLLATAVAGGDTASKWGLYSNQAKAVEGLQGKRLAVAGVGTRDADFVDNVIFDGGLQGSRFFAAQVSTPDVAAAVAAVKLHQAAAVVAPQSVMRADKAAGLKLLFDAGRVPNAAFCVLDDALPPELLTQVKGVLLGFSSNGGFEGFRGAETGLYRALAARLSGANRRPVMAEPELIRLDLEVQTTPMLPTVPSLASEFWMP